MSESEEVKKNESRCEKCGSISQELITVGCNEPYEVCVDCTLGAYIKLRQQDQEEQDAIKDIETPGRKNKGDWTADNMLAVIKHKFIACGDQRYDALVVAGIKEKEDSHHIQVMSIGPNNELQNIRHNLAWDMVKDLTEAGLDEEDAWDVFRGRLLEAKAKSKTKGLGKLGSLLTLLEGMEGLTGEDQLRGGFKEALRKMMRKAADRKDKGSERCNCKHCVERRELMAKAEEAKGQEEQGKEDD